MKLLLVRVRPCGTKEFVDHNGNRYLKKQPQTELMKDT